MKKFSLLSVVLATVASAPGARAGDINGAAMANLILNSTIPDGDLYTLGLYAGKSTDVLSTNETDTTAGFTSTMAGTYAGQTLSISYTGNSTGFTTATGGPITWTSSGSYGALDWTGSGSANFTFPSASTFQIAYTSTMSLTLGTNTLFTAAYDSTIHGANNNTALYFTYATGTLTVNGSLVDLPCPTSYTISVAVPGKIEIDDIEYEGETIILSQNKINNVSPSYPAPPVFITAAGSISFVPEPSSLVLAGIGALSLIVGHAYRRPAKAKV
jgi:hypothetical protein